VKSLLIAAIACFPLTAHAQAPKQVEVINDPLAVEVVNPAPQSPPVRWQIVGFTSASYLGNEGVLGFTRHCQTEFSDSRVCTSQEVMDTVAVPGSLTGSAWVRPVFVPVSVARYGLQGTIQMALDASGRTGSAPGTLNCNGWSSPSSSARGLVVSDAGSFSTRACNVTFSVACCALVP